MHEPSLQFAPAQWDWSELERMLRALVITQTVICALPAWWQVEPEIHAIARRLRVPIAVTPPPNLALMSLYAKQAGVDAVITTQEQLAQVRILLTTSAQPKAYIVLKADPPTFTLA